MQDPNNLPITYTFTLAQVNLILGALGKLPYEQVDQLVAGIRGVALQALKVAEDQASAQAAQTELPVAMEVTE